MTAPDLLANLRAGGFELTRDGDRIIISPASRLTGDLRAMIREHKLALLVLLAVESQTHGRTALWWERFGDALTDAHYDAVLEADCRRHGYYTPTRQYREPSEPLESIWQRSGLPVLPRED